MMRTWFGVAAAAAVCTTLACGVEAGVPGMTVRDSAGVRIVDGEVDGLPFADQSFDAVLSCFGAMFAADQERA